MSYKSEFLRAMDAKGIKYTDLEGKKVRVTYSGDNTDTIAINIIFDEDDDGYVAFRCWSFGNVPASKRAKMLDACNAANSHYRWVKFYLDDDSDLTVSADAIITMSTVGDVCIELVKRMVEIYDEQYTSFMKGMWS